MANEIIKYDAAPATLEQYANNLQVKLQMAGTLLKSGLIPPHFKTQESVLTAILYGQEIGMSPMQSLLSVTVIQGKPCLDAAGLKAKCLQAGGRFETIQWDDKSCKLRGIRGEWKEDVEFTIADAERMGLTSKDNWRRMPKAMLYARAVSIVIRNMFADVIKGFYSKEEMLDSINVPSTAIDVTPAQVVPELKTADEVEHAQAEGDDPAKYIWYAFPAKLTKEQLEYLKRRNCQKDDASGYYFCPQALDKSKEGYRVENPYIEPPHASDEATAHE